MPGHVFNEETAHLIRIGIIHVGHHPQVSLSLGGVLIESVPEVTFFAFYLAARRGAKALLGTTVRFEFHKHLSTERADHLYWQTLWGPSQDSTPWYSTVPENCPAFLSIEPPPQKAAVPLAENISPKISGLRIATAPFAPFR